MGHATGPKQFFSTRTDAACADFDKQILFARHRQANAV
jgi:hypothetical protein